MVIQDAKILVLTVTGMPEQIPHDLEQACTAVGGLRRTPSSTISPS